MMREQLKVKVRGNVNKIVQENLEDINNTFSKRVYLNADRCLYEILSEGQSNCIKSSKRDEQVANVLSFLGKRGRGKTSAMLSFHTYLENLSERNIPEWSKLRGLSNKNVVFHTFDYIDAAMLAKNEYVIDVILAKMWDKFDDLLSKPYRSERSNYDYMVKKVQDEFVKVRQAYLAMKYRELCFDKEIERERDIPAARGLHELAIGINLKESMKKLVEYYIQVFNSTLKEDCGRIGYLVFAIDDVDMANDKAWNILEQIRMYMSIPNVIVLLTADMRRLREVCEISQNQILSKDVVSTFVNDYLEKVLPVSMRINMPELLDGQFEVCIHKDELAPWNNESEKDIILELIGKNCGIYFAERRRKHHFMQNDSLRGMVNYLNRISLLEQNEYYDWLKNDLQERLIERVKDKDDKFFLKELYNIDFPDINHYIINYLRTKISGKLKSEQSKDNEINNGYSMGQALYLCSLLEEDVNELNFINSILFFYALVLSENWSNLEIRKSIIGGSVLGGWEYAVLSGKSQREANIGGLEGRAVLQFKVSEDVDIHTIGTVKYIENILQQEEKNILAWLYAMLYVDINMLESNSFRVDVEGEDIAKNSNSVRKTQGSAENSTGETEGLEDVAEQSRDGAQELSGEAEKVEEGVGELIEEIEQTKDGLQEPLKKVVWTVKPYISCKKGIFSFLYKKSEDYKKILELLLKSTITEFYRKVIEEYQLESDDSELKKVIKSGEAIIDKIKWSCDIDNKKLVVATEILYCMGQMIEVETQINEKEVEKKKKLENTYNSVYKYLVEVDSYYNGELHVEASLAENFRNSLQVKILLDEEELEQEISNKLEAYIKAIYAKSDISGSTGGNADNTVKKKISLKKDN